MMTNWNFAIVIAVVALLTSSDAAHSSNTTTTIEHQTSFTATKWNARFTPAKLEMHMDASAEVLLEISNVDTDQPNYSFQVLSRQPKLASVDQLIPADMIDRATRSWRGNITVDALFLGSTRVYVQLVDTLTNGSQPNDQHTLAVTILRRQRTIDHIFTGSVALLVSLLYINFGAALDVSVLRGLIAHPVGPVIGFLAQFIIMPLLSFGLGYLIFPDSVEMQLGLFFTGVSPSGGASNIWSVILGGNINLSVLMTTISNFAAFGMMPLWLFSLGHVIFERGNLDVPYAKIAIFAVSLVVPLAIGLAIQRCSPRLTRLLVRLLKPISTCLIVFIIVFAIATNFYLFELFSWQIVVAGLGLPWFGYVLAWFGAKALRQNAADALTIAIETGIQNTGISIFLLRFSLPQPQADLTTVIPVAVAIMTPLPLLGVYIYKRCAERNIKTGLTAEQYHEQHIN